MSEVVHTFEHAGLTVKIIHDDDSFSTNPREMYEPFGTMIFWGISNYSLGGGDDETHSHELDFEVNCERCETSGYVLAEDLTDDERKVIEQREQEPDEDGDVPCPKCEGNMYLDVGVEDYFRKEHDAGVIVPLHFSDYGSSGTRMTRDDFEDCNGVIFLTRDELDKEYSKDWLKQQGKETDDEIREFIEEQLMAHVKEYDDWGQGNVFGFAIEGPTVEDDDEPSGERIVDLDEVDGITEDAKLDSSCWGFIGDYDDEHITSQAKEAAESIRASIDKEKRERDFWAEREIVTR